MMIDSHARVILPMAQQLVLLESAGGERTVLFMTWFHLERAAELNGFEQKMAMSHAVISGHMNNTLLIGQSERKSR